MQKILLTYFFVAFCGLHVFSQNSMLPKTDKQLVEATVFELFSGYKAGDSLIVKNTFTQNAVLQTAFYNKEGKSELSQAMPVQKFLNYIGGGLEKEHDERLWDVTINIDNNLASVWAQYAFYLDGQFTHCGAENFLLIKQPIGWKIFHLVDTRQHAGCEVPDNIKNQ